MPVSRKSEAPKNGHPPPVCTTPGTAPRHYPRRVVLFKVMTDQSGSMSPWRLKQGTFVPGLTAALREAGGPRVDELVYANFVVVSGEVTASGFSQLKYATDPPYEPDGETPIGRALTVLADSLDAFVTTELVPNEVTVAGIKVALVTDLKPTGEPPDETEAGVERFLEVVTKYGAEVQLIGPSERDMNHALAKRLDVKGLGVKYLDDADPTSVFKWTFDSLLSLSRKFSGSRRRKS